MADDFAADWLTLRQPADDAARSARLMSDFAKSLPERPTIIDLGAGTGATSRALAALFPKGADWILVEQDEKLISYGEDRLKHDLPHHTFQYLQADLDRDLKKVSFGEAHGVSCSALFDLAGEAWLEQLARMIAQHQLPILAMLTYDGMIEWRPFATIDYRIVELFNIDMRQDKGLGGHASGARACATFRDFMKAQGYLCDLERSDWNLSAGQNALMEKLQRGIVDAVRLLSPDLISENWLATRADQLKRNELQMTVGHSDLLAMPPRLD